MPRREFLQPRSQVFPHPACPLNQIQTLILPDGQNRSEDLFLCDSHIRRYEIDHRRTDIETLFLALNDAIPAVDQNPGSLLPGLGDVAFDSFFRLARDHR
jgi:hypothetical protein